MDQAAAFPVLGQARRWKLRLFLVLGLPKSGNCGLVSSFGPFRNTFGPAQSLFIKKDLKNKYEILEFDPYMVELKANSFGWQKSKYLCFIYLHQKGSPWYNTDYAMNFEQLESDLARFKNKVDVLILGNLNARTALELDYSSINPSDNYFPFPQDNDAADDDNYKCKLPNRRNMDHSGAVKGHRKELTQFCKDSGLEIGNGRLKGDEYGAFTFCNKKALTTIDHILLEEEMFDCVNNFTVSDFTSFSDHAYLQFDLKINDNDN